MTSTDGDLLLCTEAFLHDHQHRLAAVAPDLRPLVIGTTGDPDDGDLGRVAVAYLSNDVWPDLATGFIGATVQAPGLRWLHTFSAGVDHPVFDALLDRGVRITTSSGASAPAIAETVFLYLLALGHDLPRVLDAGGEQRWEWFRWNELHGKRVLVVGYGPIGQAVVARSLAFGMEPTVLRRAAQGDELCPVRPLAELHDAVAGTDIVIVALAATDETRGIVSAEVIGAMAPGTVLVNVARGELLDQNAVTEALRSGHLGGAGLDVFTPEPLPATDPLWVLDNVIVTPHSAGSSDGSLRRVIELFFDNLTRWQANRPLRNEISR